MKANRSPSPVQQNAALCSNQKNRIDPIDLYLNPEKHLTERQRTAIDLLLRGSSDSEIGRQIGVDRNTVARWRKNDAFRDCMEKQRTQLWEQSASRMQSMLDPALDILQKHLTSDDPKASLRAAALLLRIANPARQPRSKPTAEEDPFKKIEKYINAPVPGQPGSPADFLDVDDDDDVT